MAGGSSKVVISTQVRMELQNQAKIMQEVKTSLQNAIASVDGSSALGKSFTKLFDQVESRSNKISNLLNKEIFSEQDLVKVASLMESISDSFGEIGRKIQGANYAQLGLETKEIIEAKKALDAFEKRIISLKSKTAAEALGKWPDELKKLIALKDQIDFNPGESLTKNIGNADKVLRSTRGELAELVATSDEAKESLEAVQEKLRNLEVEKSVTQSKLSIRTNRNAELAQQFAAVKTGTGKSRTKENVFEDYSNILNSWIDSTTQNFTAEGQLFSEIFAKWLTVDYSTLGSSAKEIVDNLTKALESQLRGSNGKLSFDAVKTWTSKILAGNMGEVDSGVTELQQTVQTIDNTITATTSEVVDATNAVTDIEGQIQKAQNLIATISAQLEKLKQLRKKYEELIDDENAGEKARLLANSNFAIEGVEGPAHREAAKEVRRGQHSALIGNNIKDASIENRKLQEEAQREADNFKNNLKQTINHWLSAQMIITKVRDGIHQAWTDIQGLDKAMTNIAVVTDMSVSDLWSKIDEYMAIAQEYGVTTQGVYEVSQLYYQQGLSTSEVMAATTETLKMARIAGMDYADAADAMTVAIRAFKMEMSDAQIITDVYSKVAAVTASDSQELAIAMSKTASSAESVGSSFENTTAMLAVMIETTRESAQNLGSALKSIISRYGEMKTGLTVDSEGEAIDYNKVDTALKSVGISIKDAQGQFRNFDDVIFELSKKWDSLDKNTQRYIATIMAGNRQQSRFIALVDNWERLDEVSAAAYDSEDAGLLQYAKTLDSLETKLNALSTSFQQFYMNIVDGDFFGNIIKGITAILNGLNKISSFNTILSAVTFIKGLKSIFNFAEQKAFSTLEKIYKNYKQIQKGMTTTAKEEIDERARYQQQVEGSIEIQPRRRRRQTNIEEPGIDLLNAKIGKIANIANMAGSLLVGIGTAQAIAGKDYSEKNTGEVRGAFTTAIGNILSNAATGAALGTAIGTSAGPGIGNAVGAVVGASIGAIVTLISETISAIVPTIDKVEQQRYENIKKETEEKNIKRAEAKEEYNNLKTLLDTYNSTKEKKFNSDEDYKNWINANNALVEAYPELIGYIDEQGNAIADVTNASEILAKRMSDASEATNLYYNSKISELEQETKAAAKHVFRTDYFDGVLDGDKISLYKELDANGLPTLFSGYSTDSETIDKWLRSKGISDIYDVVQFLSGVNNGIDKNIADTLLDFKVITQNASGIYEIDDNYLKYMSRSQTAAEIETLKKTQSQSHLNFLSKNTLLDDEIQKVSGWTDLFFTYATRIKNISEKTLSELSQTDYESLISTFTEFYTGLSSGNQTIFNNLYENLDKYSAESLDDLLLNQFGLTTDSEIYKTFEQKWFDTNYKTKYNYAKLIWQDDFEFDDYTTWLTKQEDISNTEENRQKYAKEVGNKVREMSDDLAHFVDTAADSTLEAYAGYLTKERSIIKNGGNAGAIAQKRLDYVNQLIGNGILDKIDEDSLAQFISLLFSENAGTNDWAISLAKFATENNLDLDVTPFIHENINTQLENLKAEQVSVTESVKGLFEKQSKGFTISDAENLIAKYDLEGSINDYFIIENGQLILKNYTDFIGLIIDKFNATSQTLKDDIIEARQIIADGWLDNAPIDNKIIRWAQEIANGKDLKDTIATGLLNSGFDSALADEIATEFQAGNIKTVGELQQYLYKRYENIALIDQLLGEQLKEYQNNAEEVSNFIRNQKFGVTDTNLALNKIISKGFKDIQIAELEALSKALQKPIDEIIGILGLEYNAGSESWQGKNFAYLVEERNKLAQLTNMGQSGTDEQIARFKELNGIIHAITTGSGLDFDEVLISSIQSLRSTQEVLEDSFSDGIISYSELESITNGQQDAFIKAYEGVLFDYNESLRGYVLKQGATVPSAEEMQEKYGFSINSEDWERWSSLALKNWKESLNNYIEQGGKNLTIEDQGTAKLALQGLGIKESDLGQYLNGDSLNIQALANFGYEAAVIYVSNLTDSINDDFNSYFENLTEVNFEDLAQLYKNITGNEEIDPDLVKEYYSAIDEAKKGNTKLLSNILLQMVEEAQQQGYNIDITTLQNTIQDAALSLIATIAKTIESGIDGTMTNADYTQLLKDIGVNQFEPDGSISQDWERWQNMVYSTNEGLKFTKQGLLDIYGVVASRNAMASQGILEMIAEDYREYDNLSSTLAHIRELRDLRDKADPTKRKQYEQELEIAEKIARIRSQDPDSFNFMERAIPDEIQSPLNIWQNAADAASALQDAKKNGYMGAEDFYRIVTTASEYMTAAGQEFSIAGMTYKDLISKATSSLATANGSLVVDFSKFGVDFAGGIDDMAGGLEDGLKELAKQQIEMLDGMIAMLKTMKTIQEAANAIKDENGNGLFDFEELFNFNELTGIATLKEETITWWNEFQTVFGIMTFDGLQLDDAWKKGIIKATEITKFMNDAQNIIDNATSDINGMITQLTGAAQSAFGTDVAIKLGLNLEKQFEFKDDGTIIYNNTTYPNQEAALAAWKQTVAQTTDGFTDQIGPVITDDGTVITYKRDIETDIIYEVHTNKDRVSTFVVNDVPCESEEELNKKLQELAPEAKTIEGETSENQFLTGGVYSGVEYKVGNQIKVSDQDGNNSVILGEGKSLATWIKETFESITEEGTNKSGEEHWFDGGNYSGIKYQFGTAVQVNGQPYANISEFITQALGSAIQSQSEYATVNMNLTATADTDQAKANLDEVITKLGTIEKAKNREVTITASTSRAYNQLNSILNLINGIKSKTVTIHTQYTSSGTPPSSSGNTTNEKYRNPDGTYGAKGTVNGKALAKGRGTLMGELGPELYVQRGRYHLAGSNGAEFVDLDDDAIVFNHLQTRRILKTGHTFGRGKPVTNEKTAVAFATGNVTGPALAGGIDSAIKQLETAREFWKGLLNQLSLPELMAGSGKNKGGGSGNSIKAVTEELQEWYNLSRQIADIEQDINNLLAERENIEWSNGEAYLKSLREQQKLLNQQIATQQALLDYQELQLKRQAQHINQNRIWSQFLTVGEDGLLQYIEGNETNGGKGALQVLQELNQMSGEEQSAYLKRIGYSYTNNDGKKLEGQELVEQFFQELQDQIDQYDALYDTVHETEETLENLRSEIKDINEQIKENQMDLEEAVFDIIVSAWEKEIEQMEEQADLIKEANEAYINGLNNALSAERQMYDDNQKVADREQLQRQLSLLRRSGGSASEIANLEEQLDDMLKDEYFNNQEQMIEDIRQANDIQVQQLDTQIRLQQEALEYQKENGVIWTQVYEVLSQSREEILDFMQGNSTEFFSQSLLQQEQMLTEWAHKIGIYKEDQKYQNYVNHAKTNIWDNGQIWNIGNTSKYQDVYAQMSEDERNTLRDQFTSVYAQARLDGKDHNTAAQEAAEAVSSTLKRKQDAINSQNNTPPFTTPNPQNPGGGDNSGGGNSGGSSGGGSSDSTYDTVSLTCTAGNTGGSPKLSTYSAKPKQSVTIYPNANNGYAFDYLTYNGRKKTSATITPTGEVKSIAIVVYYKKTTSSNTSSTNNSSTTNDVDVVSGAAPSNKGKWYYVLNGPNKEKIKSTEVWTNRGDAQAAAEIARRKKGSNWKYSTFQYMNGGLVDYTGLAMVHGSKQKPESFLNAEQTAQIREGLEITSGKSSVLEGVKDTLLKLNSSIQSLTNITNKTESNTYTIAPGAVVIQVEQLNDAYDVDTLSADIMNRMYAIGNKSTNRGVSRR